jgi:hypothetical protein
MSEGDRDLGAGEREAQSRAAGAAGFDRGRLGLEPCIDAAPAVEIADVDAAAPLEVPSMDELIAIASERARSGNMSAVAWLAQRQPDEREADFARLLERLGAGSR